jgi:thioredoxin 1
MTEDIIYLTDEDFQNAISNGVTLVDFYADWCGPCKRMEPIIHELAAELKGQAVIAKFDVEKYQTVPGNFNVTSIPTVIVFKDGKEYQRIIGLRDKQTLKSMITALL